MTGQDPNNQVSGNQPPTHPTNPSDKTTNNHKSGNSQNQVHHRASKLSLSSSSDSSSSDSSSGPEPTPTPSPAYSASQSSSDFDSSSSEDQHDNRRHVRFRSYESIRYFEEDVPTKNPPLYPHTHRRKKRFRKKHFPLDTDISCGRSILETLEGDAIRKYHSGNSGRAEDYFLWDEMLQGQRVVTTLKRSKTVPGSPLRSLTKDEASGFYRFYRFPPTTHDYVMTGNPFDDGGRQSRTIRHFQPTPGMFDFNFDKFRIHHQGPEMSRFDVEDWLTHASGLEHPWADIEPLSLVFQTTSSECSSLSDISADLTSSYAAESSSAATTGLTSSNTIGHTNQQLPITFSQGYSTSNVIFSLTPGSSSPKPFKPKHKRRSAPATSTSTRYPQPSQLYQLGAVATQSRISIHVTEGSSAHRQDDNGAGVGHGSGSFQSNSPASPPSQLTSSTSSLRPTSTISSPHTPVPQATANGSNIRCPSSLAMSRQQQASATSNPTETFSCSSPQRQREMEQKKQQARQQLGHRRTNAQVISQFLTPLYNIGQPTSSRTGPPSRHSTPASAAPSRPPPSRSSAPAQPLSQMPPHTNETGSTPIRNSTNPSNSDSGSRTSTGTAGGATLESSTTHLSSGPPQSSWLTNPSLEDVTLPALKYRIPRPATVSPILHAVMSAASHGLAYNGSQGKVDDDDDVPILDLTSLFPMVPRNAVWEANARASNLNPGPSQKPRTATENEDVRRGEQTDRSIRDSRPQKVPKQILQNNHIQEILDDYYIDEEQVVNEDEHYNKSREAEGEGELAGGHYDTQAQIENDKGKKKKKKTLLQRVKSAFTKKPKKTPDAG
ncbi:hypothetical protein KI688_010354 [Linnemannia hyalina]|uniref:Uncharacterized protein n=1 Tax=Linnemannia hyalina TaxID=64524 RepID=A0A9P7XYH0_9FUNG|nr:hypothetical protein KI688_010354 [Linnemannia hyalina]